MNEAWRALLFADEDQHRLGQRDPVAPATRSGAALADDEIDCGPLTPETGVWPCPALEAPFRALCGEAYQATRDLVARPRAQQESRSRRGPG